MARVSPLQRAVDFLAPLGLLVIVGAAAWQRTGRTLPGKPEYYWIAGAALILAQLLLRWEDVASRIGRRQMRYGTNTAVLVVAVVGILGLVNYLVNRHSKRWDLTKGQRYSLSDQSKKVLSSLKEDVTVWYFQRSADMASGKDRLKEYQAVSPRVKVQFVDPITQPARAREYDARGPWPVIVVERGSRREKVSNDSEQDITNAFIKVTRDAKKTVCFVEGEGERDIDDSGERGYSSAKSALNRSQYETKKVFLAREGKVPADCTVLAVTGPEKDLLPPALEAIRAFVKGGGKLLVMVEAPIGDDPDTPQLAALLKEWNLEVGRDVVVDVSGMGQLFGAGELTPVALQYPYHEITRDFRVMTVFHTARSLQSGSGSVEGVTAQNLLQTSPASWAETDLTLKSPVRADEGKDRQGPIALGAVATTTVTNPSPAPSASPSPGAAASAAPGASVSPAASPSPSASPEAEAEPPPRREGRVAAFGDSDFASNALLGVQGNQDFFLNTVAWLAEDADLISIRPREPEDQRMFLTQDKQQNVMLLSLLFLPGLFVALGVWNWWQRR